MATYWLLTAMFLLLTASEWMAVSGGGTPTPKGPWYPKYYHHHHKYKHWPYWKYKCGYGSVCKDPVMKTQTGEAFYFHGYKDGDFCLVTDTDLHINAHFIGRRDPAVSRDFTWVQSLGVLYGSNQIYIGVKKVAVWEQSVDQLVFIVNSEGPLVLPPTQGSVWKSAAAGITITRLDDSNVATLEVEGKVKLTVHATPVTVEEDKKSGYGIPFGTDCMAHLDVSFEFVSLSSKVDGVLGHTYAPSFRMLEKKPGQHLPTLGGTHKYVSSRLMAPDCSVATFNSAFSDKLHTQPLVLSQQLNCASATSGSGMICRR